MGWLKAIIEHNTGGNMAKTALEVKAKAKAKTAPRTTEKGGDNFSKAKTCLSMIGNSTYEFDVLMAQIYEGKEWEAKGYETFEEACQPELGMGYRTALNHVAAGQAILRHGITKEQAAQIGWTNFVEISSLFKSDMKKSEIDGLIKKASKMSHDEVVKFKKEVRHQMVGGTTQTRVKMTFTFLDEQAQVVQEAINMAKELMGLDHDDLALEYALVEWMGNHDPDKVNEIKSQLKGDVEEEEAEENEEDEVEETPAPKAHRKERADQVAKKKSKKEADEDEEDEGDDEDDDLGI